MKKWIIEGEAMDFQFRTPGVDLEISFPNCFERVVFTQDTTKQVPWVICSMIKGAEGCMHREDHVDGQYVQLALNGSEPPYLMSDGRTVQIGVHQIVFSWSVRLVEQAEDAPKEV